MRELWNIPVSRLFLAGLFAVLSLMLTLSGCGRTEENSETKSGITENASENSSETAGGGADYTLETKVTDVISDPVFGDYGRLIFPADRSSDEDLELQDLDEILMWYNNVNPERTVEIANYLKNQAASGEQIFYDIYTDEEKAEDPEKENTGLFFFRGDPGAKTAIVNAGARMAAWLGAYGTSEFGEEEYPAPAAVIMQYTGLSDVTGDEPPTYACVGTSDGIASYRSMENYISRIQDNGTDAQVEVFDGLRHGFGLGEGTAAEGWIDRAVSFWERQC